MTGIFNNIGHEFEDQADAAASVLFLGLASVNQMLSRVELSDVNGAIEEKANTTRILTDAQERFEELLNVVDDRPWPELPHAENDERTELLELLDSYDVSAHGSRDLFGIAVSEVHTLEETVKLAPFTGGHRDWYSVRDVVRQMNRLTTLGVVCSRMASLNGDDPRLER